MQRLRRIVESLLTERPSRTENLMIGVFQFIMGAFLLLPFNSFALSIKVDGQSVFSSLSENQFGTIMIVLGVVQAISSWKMKWEFLKGWILISFGFWLFVSVGYLMVFPQGTPLVTISMFTLLLLYQYIELCYWHGRNLRYNKKIDSI